jgi:hypothetical protein
MELYGPVLTKALDDWDNVETDTHGLGLLNAFIGFLGMSAIILIPPMHAFRAAIGNVLVKLPDGDQYMLPIGGGGPATIGLGAPIRSVPSHPDESDKVQAEARLFQEAERLHKIGRPRKGTQFILPHGVAPANPVTENLMRDMHPRSRGLDFSDDQVPQELISPETTFANVTSATQKKDCTNGPFGWSDDKWDRCPDPPGGGNHLLKALYARLIARMAS